jgi:hypothetical protein
VLNKDLLPEKCANSLESKIQSSPSWRLRASNAASSSSSKGRLGENGSLELLSRMLAPNCCGLYPPCIVLVLKLGKVPLSKDP